MKNDVVIKLKVKCWERLLTDEEILLTYQEELVSQPGEDE